MGIALKSDTYMALLLFPQVMSEPKSQCTNRVRYDYSELRPYSTAYLPDFLADRFDVTMEQRRKQVDRRCAGTLEASQRNTVQDYGTWRRQSPAGEGTLRPHARVDAEHQMAGKGLPLRHERPDRQAGGRSAHEPGEILGAVRRHCRAAVHPDFAARKASAGIKRDFGYEKENLNSRTGLSAGAVPPCTRHGGIGIRHDLCRDGGSGLPDVDLSGWRKCSPR